MHIRKVIVRIIIFLAFIALFVFPVIMIYKLSEKEKKTYIQNDNYTYKEVSYGKIKCVELKDIEYYFETNGEISSNTVEKIVIPNEEDTILVKEGQEIYKGDPILKHGNDTIVSNYNGLVQSIDLYSEKCINILSFEKLQLICYLDLDKANSIKKTEKFHLEDGSTLTLESVSNMFENGKRKVIFNLNNSENYLFGQELSDLKIYNGTVFKDVFVIDKDCVYEKNGSMCIRVVDDKGFFKNEQNVEVGFETGDLVCVTNVKEGTLCDSGYKSLVNYNEDMK